MSMNLRADDTFVEDKGWHEASSRRIDFLLRHNRGHILYLELGVGYNTPGIIKYPFFSMTAEDKDNLYVCINTSDMRVPDLIRDRAVCIKGILGKCWIGSETEKHIIFEKINHVTYVTR